MRHELIVKIVLRLQLQFVLVVQGAVLLARSLQIFLFFCYGIQCLGSLVSRLRWLSICGLEVSSQFDVLVLEALDDV